MTLIPDQYCIHLSHSHVVHTPIYLSVQPSAKCWAVYILLVTRYLLLHLTVRGGCSGGLAVYTPKHKQIYKYNHVSNQACLYDSLRVDIANIIGLLYDAPLLFFLLLDSFSLYLLWTHFPIVTSFSVQSYCNFNSPEFRRNEVESDCCISVHSQHYYVVKTNNSGAPF